MSVQRAPERSALVALVVAMMLACGLSPEAPLKVSDDRAGLAKHVSVPAPLTSVRWAAHALGSPGLGPTDLELVAVFDVAEADRPAVEAVVPEIAPSVELAVPAALAEAVGLPAAPVTGREISGAAFENHRWRCVGAARTEDQVVVWMVSL